MYVSVLAYKGGVGKTTLAASLAAGLSLLKGRRILVVDFDPQANLTEVFLTPKAFMEAVDRSYKENLVFSLDAAVFPDRRPVLMQVPGADNLFIIPSHPKYIGLSGIHGYISPERARTFRAMLSKLVEEHGFDYVIMDFPPQMYNIVTPIAASSDCILAPASKGAFTMSSIHYMLSIFYRFTRSVAAESAPRLLGIVLTKYFGNESYQIRRAKEKIRKAVRDTFTSLALKPPEYDPVFYTVLFYNTIVMQITGNERQREPMIVKLFKGQFKSFRREYLRARYVSNVEKLVGEFEERVASICRS